MSRRRRTPHCACPSRTRHCGRFHAFRKGRRRPRTGASTTYGNVRRYTFSPRPFGRVNRRLYGKRRLIFTGPFIYTKRPVRRRSKDRDAVNLALGAGLGYRRTTVTAHCIRRLVELPGFRLLVKIKNLNLFSKYTSAFSNIYFSVTCHQWAY